MRGEKSWMDEALADVNDVEKEEALLILIPVKRVDKRKEVWYIKVG